MFIRRAKLDADLEVRAHLNPTEDEEKVVKSILSIFKVKVNVVQDEAIGCSRDINALRKLKRMIRQRRIRSAARAVMKSGIRGNVVEFYLHKQAAYAGKVSFSNAEGESPLGPIKVTIKTDDPNKLVEWLTE
ncbi:MAG: RNA-binding domain-containing protein [Nitrososphaerota archaeon]|nr:RNA-binding domain-containing protein [Nitrososphaerota archaeon]